MELDCAAVLFDLDGTLVDSRAAVEHAWRVAAREYGTDPEPVLAVCQGRRSSDTVAEFFPPEQREAVTQRVDELELTDLDGVVALPGAPELLAACPADRVAIVTSCPPELLQARADAAGVPLPDVVVTSAQVTGGKPDPEGYLLAASKLGVEPSECVVVEDAPAGVRAGRNAEATVVAMPTTTPASELGEAHVIVPSPAHVGVQPGGVGLTLHLHRS